MMMTFGFIFSSIIGALLGAAVAAMLCHRSRRREVREALNEDDEAIRALYRRLQQPAAPEAAGHQVVASIRQGARRLLDIAVALVASAAGLVKLQPALAAEYERGIRATLGTVKGLLDCTDSLVAPLAVVQRHAAGHLLKHVEQLRQILEGQISRHRLNGFDLGDEAERVARLKNALLANASLVESDPQQVVAALGRQIGFLIEILSDVDLKTMGLPRS